MTLVKMILRLLVDTGNGTGRCVCVCAFSLKTSLLKKLEHFFSI